MALRTRVVSRVNITRQMAALGANAAANPVLCPGQICLRGATPPMGAGQHVARAGDVVRGEQGTLVPNTQPILR